MSSHEIHHKFSVGQPVIIKTFNVVDIIAETAYLLDSPYYGFRSFNYFEYEIHLDSAYSLHHLLWGYPKRR